VESSPQLRRVEIDGALWNRGGPSAQATLALPYVVMLVTITSGHVDPGEVYMFFRNRSLMGSNDLLGENLHPPPLPNIFPNCRVCTGDLGDAARLAEEATGSPSQQAVLAAEWVWRSRFTTHLKSIFFEPAARVDRRLESFRAWNRASIADRDFIVRIPWERLGRQTVREAVSAALGSHLATIGNG